MATLRKIGRRSKRRAPAPELDAPPAPADLSGLDDRAVLRAYEAAIAACNGWHAAQGREPWELAPHDARAGELERERERVGRELDRRRSRTSAPAGG